MLPFKKKPNTLALSQHLLVALILVTLLTCGNPPAFAAEVKSISIFSTHGTIGGYQSECNYKIIRTERGYKGNLAHFDINWNIEELQRRGLAPTPFESFTDKKLMHFVMNHREITDDIPVANNKIKKFMESLQAEPIQKLDMDQLGITKQWLEEKAEAALDIDVLQKRLNKNATPERPDLKLLEFFDFPLIKQWLLHRMTDLSRTTAVLKRHYQEPWYDDYPEIKVEIVFNNGERMSVASKGQHAYMIPWEIKKKTTSFKTFDIRISQGLVQILPPQCPAFEKINTNFLKLFKDRFWDEYIGSLLATVYADKVLEKQISPIKKHFTILSSRLAHDWISKEGKSIPVQWEAKFIQNQAPQNLFVKFSAKIKEGKTDLTKYSPEKINHYLNQVLSVPWLKTFIEEHPYHDFFLEFENGRSTNPEWYGKTVKKCGTYRLRMARFGFPSL
jgi:hypothetical protein